MEKKEGARRPSLVENKEMTDAYKEYAGYFAIFTTDLNKTEDELVIDSYELEFIQRRYTGAKSFAEEWVGFGGDYREIMDGILLPMILKENMEVYWRRRLWGNEVFEKNGHSVLDMFFDLGHITVKNDDGTLIIRYCDEYAGCDENVLLAFGFTEQDAKDYAQRILDTPEYFHEMEAILWEEEEAGYW